MLLVFLITYTFYDYSHPFFCQGECRRKGELILQKLIFITCEGIVFICCFPNHVYFLQLKLSVIFMLWGVTQEGRACIMDANFHNMWRNRIYLLFHIYFLQLNIYTFYNCNYPFFEMLRELAQEGRAYISKLSYHVKESYLSVVFLIIYTFFYNCNFPSFWVSVAGSCRNGGIILWTLIFISCEGIILGVCFLFTYTFYDYPYPFYVSLHTDSWNRW